MTKIYSFIIVILLLISNHFLFAQTLTKAQEKQIDDYKKQIITAKTSNNSPIIVNYLTKIGNIYWHANMTNPAIEAFTEALNYLKTSANTGAKIQLNNQLGYLHMSNENYPQAEKNFNTAYKLGQNHTDKINKASTLTNIGQCKQNQQKYNEAISIYDEALTFALEIDNLQMVKNISLKIAKCYEALKDEQNYIKYYNLSFNFDKKIKEEEISQKEKALSKQKQISKQQGLIITLQKYKNRLVSDSLTRQQNLSKQKEIEIQLLNKNKELQKLEIKKKEAELQNRKQKDKNRKIIITILSTGFIIILIAFVIIFKMFIQNKKQKEKLYKLNTELTQKNEQIEKHRHEVEQKNKQITDSINYASRIQRAILPVKFAIEKSFKNVFIFYRPRDVVSGDFYWYAEINDKKILATIDCTGHSVPGAFMSMIANTLLNEIVKAKKETELDIILSTLNKGIADTLNSKENENEDELNDGMDITLFRLDKNNRTAKFAGANHVIIVFVDGKINIIETNYHSIGGITEGEDIKFKQISLNMGNKATVYMFSDGYTDQFNEKGKKYKTKNFIKLLEKIHTKPIKKQEQILSTEFDQWKGTYRQVDDVIVIGIEV